MHFWTFCANEQSLSEAQFILAQATEERLDD